MAYVFSYKPKDYIKQHAFTYNAPYGEHRNFTYARDIRSDLSLYNAPVFMHKETRGGFLSGTADTVKKWHPLNYIPEGRPFLKNSHDSFIQDGRYADKKGNSIKILPDGVNALHDGKHVGIHDAFSGITKNGNAMMYAAPELWGILKKPAWMDSYGIFARLYKPVSIHDTDIHGTIRKPAWFTEEVHAELSKGVNILNGVSVHVPYREPVMTDSGGIFAERILRMSMYDYCSAEKAIRISIFKTHGLEQKIYHTNWYEDSSVKKTASVYYVDKGMVLPVYKDPFETLSIVDGFILPKAEKQTDTSFYEMVHGGAVAYRTSFSHNFIKGLYKESPFNASVNTCKAVLKNIYISHVNKHYPAVKNEYVSHVNDITSGVISERLCYKNHILEMYKKVHKGALPAGYRSFVKARKKGFIKDGIRDVRKMWKYASMALPGIDIHKMPKSTLMIKRNEFIEKLSKPFEFTPGSEFVYKSNVVPVFTDSSYKPVYRKRYALTISDSGASGWKDSRKLSASMDNVFLQGFDKDFSINDTSVHLYKDAYRFSIHKNGKHLYRLKSGIAINDTEKHMYHDTRPTMTILSEEFLKRESYEVSVNNTERFLYREKYEINPKEYTESLYRKKYPLFCNMNETFLHRERYPVRFTEHTVSMSSHRRGINGLHTDEWLYRDRYTININNTEKQLVRALYRVSESASEKDLLKLPYDLMLDIGNMWLDRTVKYSQRDDTNVSLLKSMLHVFLDNKEEFLKRDAKEAGIDDGEWLDGPLKHIFTMHEIMMYHYDKQAFVQGILPAYVAPKEVSVYKQESMRGEYKKVWIEEWKGAESFHEGIWKYKDTWLSGCSKKLYINKDIHGIIDTKEFSIYNDSSGMIIDNKKISVYDEYWTEKILRISLPEDTWLSGKTKSIITDSTLEGIMSDWKAAGFMNALLEMKKEDAEIAVNEIIRMRTFVKEMEKPVEKTYEWAWVYSPDQTIEQDENYHGLDELLLPECDVDYSKFEDYIFNKNKLIPRNPVEIIDDTTFIAKLPIAHPTPDYKDVGIVYIDVRSELMYKIFCKYYEIWYANIYKFGNMSMVDSLRLMLDFMYSWIILEYSGTEYFKEALRVFRQIRWFGEKSVMKNARYLIHYDKCDLVCNMKDGILKEINNNLTGNTGFRVNAGINAIMASPENYRNDASMTLYVEAREDTELKFNVSQAGGKVITRIDGMLVSDTSRSVDLVVVPVPEGRHEVTIFRPAEHNYASCYIGNITLKGHGFKNLEITYDPSLRLGNMPLDDVAHKMMELALLYEDEADAFERYRKGNLAVSELYKELERYWRLHHENKIKGKRLTIKEAGI